MQLRRFSILVVDSDRTHAMLLSQALASAGHHVLAARDGAHAHGILLYRGFDFLIVNEKDAMAHEVDLLAWAKQLCPRPHTVVIGRGESPSERQGFLERGASLYLTKPVNLEHLAQYVSQAASHGSFSGTVDEVDILEYVQFVMLSGRKTALEVVSNLGTRAVLFLAGGTVYHATCGRVIGEEAFYRCMEFKAGTFSHTSGLGVQEPTIDKPGDSLLMEAARRRDQRRSGEMATEENEDSG